MLVATEYVPSPLSWNANAGPDIDIAGIVVVAFTTAPLTALPDASLTEIEIVSLPCFGGAGSNDIVIVKSPDEEAGVNVVADDADDDDEPPDPQPIKARVSATDARAFFMILVPFRIRCDHPRSSAGRRQQDQRAPERAQLFFMLRRPPRAHQEFPTR